MCPRIRLQFLEIIGGGLNIEPEGTILHFHCNSLGCNYSFRLPFSRAIEAVAKKLTLEPLLLDNERIIELTEIFEQLRQRGYVFWVGNNFSELSFTFPGSWHSVEDRLYLHTLQGDVKIADFVWISYQHDAWQVG